MKCRGCPWQSVGINDDGSKLMYCIGSPHHGPKYGAETKIDKNRIIYNVSGDNYRANDDDECHCWFSERFEGEK